jgi:lipopolysaccharide export system protein LptA
MRRRNADPSLATSALLALLVLSPSMLAARSTDREQPMNIEADYADATLAADSQSVLRNVVITQGTMRIAAATATVTRVADEITRVLLEGAPASLQQENDNGAMMKASANRIDYDTAADVVVLTGSVMVDEGTNTMSGERITYDLNSGQLNAGAEGSRIRMTIQPKPAAPKEGGTP